MSQKILDLQAISKAFFGVYAVREVSLSIEAGHILGLIGQNGAGKSTLMNIIGGVVPLDAGYILLGGQPYTPIGPADANKAGIAFIHQELNLFTNLSIAENIFIDSFPSNRFGPLSIINRAVMHKKTRELLAAVDLEVSPDTIVEHLSPGERQLVEIARALHLDARIIIFDEPTTSLAARETKKLFEIMNRLREAGKTMIYISHILADVLQLADDIAVMRDGVLVEASSKDAFDVNRMISLMVGRNIEQLYPPRTSTAQKQSVMEIKNLSQSGIIRDVNLTLQKGEVLGLFGLMGSGRTELARIIFGIDDFEQGEIIVEGNSVRNRSPRESIHSRVAFVTENRREEGLMMSLTIADNIAVASLPEFAHTPLHLIDQNRMIATANNMANALQIKSNSIDSQAAKSLSGGNQQKVVIAKWLMSRPTIFIMDEPTRGIDVSAKYEIYSIINDLAAQGRSVLFISSELEELIGMCDRILVMSRGEVMAEFGRENFNQEQILRSAFREGNSEG
ncbi:MAG: sugar ABC transporter ATP-binding protein [Anaerolineae bacterium]|nr:sugar ABC transporter ATP-binding protein [Anaerolineae bacterium]